MRMVTALLKGNNAEEVGKELVKSVRTKLGGQEIAFGLLYASSVFDHVKLVKTVQRELGQVPLIGCTTGGEFTEEKVEKQSVVLAAFSKSDAFVYHVAMAEGLHADAMACMQAVVNSIPAPAAGYPHRSAILLHDGLAGRGEEAVLSATTILGPNVSFAGGSAGDDLAFKKTFVFCNGKVATDAVALCVIDSKHPVAVGVKHGHSPVTGQMTVTKAVDNVLYEVDGQPAWEVWKTQLREKAKSLNINVDKLQAATDIGAFLIRYELGLVSTSGEYKVRVPLSKNEDGSLNFACTIPEGAKFKIMESPKPAQIESAKVAARMAKEQMPNTAIGAALVFDCVCRAIILGDEFAQGVKSISQVIGKNVPLVGFETYGEICRRSGQASGYHNTTTVVMLLPAE